MVKAVLWDSDGVLVDTETVFFEATCEVLAQAGVVLTREYWARHYLGEGQSSAQVVQSLGLAPDDTEGWLSHRNAVFRQRLQRGVAVLPDVRETLERLHGRVRLAIVTGSTREHFLLTHRDTSLLPFFDLILTFEDYAKPKPFPDSYLTALQRLELTAGDCLAVEDSPRGVRAATAAGVPCVLVPTALTDLELCRGLCRTEPTVAGVLRWIETHQPR